jgi:hypothetical protein
MIGGWDGCGGLLWLEEAVRTFWVSRVRVAGRAGQKQWISGRRGLVWADWAARVHPFIGLGEFRAYSWPVKRLGLVWLLGLVGMVGADWMARAHQVGGPGWHPFIQWVCGALGAGGAGGAGVYGWMVQVRSVSLAAWVLCIQ